MSDPFTPHLAPVTRSVVETHRDGAAAKSVTLTRLYATDPDDLWQALTSPERLPRWFAPVSGDFHEGGRYAITGNASGTIVVCNPPEWLDLTWEFGGDVSWVEVTLQPEGGETRLTLVHTVPVNPHWEQFGPGAVGVGWDLALLGLALHLAGGEKIDEEAFHTLPGGAEFIRGAAADWATSEAASGEAKDVADVRAARVAAFYTGEAPPA